MSRRSAASLAVVQALPDARTPAPRVLNATEAELWRAVVDSKPADWFGADSVPVLTEYVRAACACDMLDAWLKRLLDEDGSTGDVRIILDMRDKESRRVANLATKLRLTQQSRYTPQAASTADRKVAGKRPWQG